MIRRVKDQPSTNKVNMGFRTSPRANKFHRLNHDILKKKKKTNRSINADSFRRQPSFWYPYEEHGINIEIFSFSFLADFVTGYFWKVYGTESEE